MAKPHWFGEHYVAPLVRYCLCLDEKTYLAECKKLNIGSPTPFLKEGSGATTHFADGDKGVSVALVCMSIKEERTILAHYALLVHEAVHVYQEMMAQMREERAGKEVEAYYIQRISLDLMDELEKYLKDNPSAHPDYR